MPRQSRIDASGALHHVLIRGVERSKIFQGHADYDFGNLRRRAATLCGLSPEEIPTGNKLPRVIEARSRFCFWAVRELGMSATAVAKWLDISQPAVSILVRGGEKIS